MNDFSSSDSPGGTAPVPLSVLDLATVGHGTSASEALRTSVLLAQQAEARGYHRFWVAEHHSLPEVASSSPAVLLSHVAALTRTIRLGSGGVMLPNHAPLVVSEQFGMLDALAPGRIDLGIERAPGTDHAAAAALRRTHSPQHGVDGFSEQLHELAGFLHGEHPPGHRYADVHAIPGPVQGTLPGGVPSTTHPTMWLLGSSEFSARLAAQLGLPFAFAHHLAPQHTDVALDTYRSSFQPSAALDRPYAMVTVQALAAEDESEAYLQVLTGVISMMRTQRGHKALMPTPEAAKRHTFTPPERAFLRDWLTSVEYGTPDAVRAGLNRLVERTQADELLITTYVHGLQTRLRSFGLIADAYGMSAAQSEHRRLA
ncbi:LLM class flavin-dependent oxidoreductase [Streptomyces sp. NPDC006147]|uniref:LLM class flavin-dependent oxidoreductase n=1 Tax=Streptomyces sp. NPDC006147 TaxID=3155597 RepID=UPI0033A6D8A7